MSRRRRRRRLRIAIPAVVLAIVAASALFVLMRGDGEPVVRKIPIAGRPSAVTVAAGLVWVTDDENHVVHVIDPGENEVVGEPIEVGRIPIAIAGDERAVWVAHASGSVVRIDADSKTAERPVDVGGSLTGIALSRDRVWVTDNERSELIEIDPRNMRVRDRIDMTDGSVRVAIAGDDVVVTGREDTIARVDARTKKQTVVKVGTGPIGLDYDGDLVWVANSDDGTITAVDGTQAVGIATAGRGPVAVAATDDLVWVANQDDSTVSRIDPIKRTPAGPPIGLGSHPRGLYADEQDVWVAGTNSNLVVRVAL